MSSADKKVALSVKPVSETFTMINVMIALKDHGVFDSWVAARDWVSDLDLVSPQVIWVPGHQLNALEQVLNDLDLETSVVSEQRAAEISVENKPVRGEVVVHIRMQNWEISDDLVAELKRQQLISHVLKGGNADDIYHWKDDRWYQDYQLFAFRKTDVQTIEKILSRHHCTLLSVD